MKSGKRYARYGSIAIALLTVLTVFSVMTTASAQSASVTSPNEVQSITQTVNINLNDVKYVSGPSGHYVIVNGLRLTGSAGSPALPVKNLKFKLPAGAKISDVKLTTGAESHFGNYAISPARAPVLKDGYATPAKYSPPALNKKVYSTNSFYPAKNMIYRVENNGRNTYVYVSLFPVKYNPVTGSVNVITHMTVTVQYTVSSVRAGTAPIDVPNIIITSPELKAQAQRLADFHNSTGVVSYVVTTSWIADHFTPAGNPPLNGYANSTTDPYPIIGNHTLPLDKSMILGYNYTLAKTIIAFLQNESLGNNVTYVTLFGNARMVPPSYYYVDQEAYIMAYFGYADMYDAWIPTDAMYASPNYNNTTFSYTPTFEVGRIPVDPSTAAQTVDKIIHYSATKTKGIQNVTLSGGQVFETPYFLGETGVLEPLNNGWMNGLNVTEYFHTLRNYTYDNFMKMMNNSDMIVEITHGSGFSFWHHNDEVSAWDFPMTGTYGSLPIYISGSCLNGAWDEGMYPSYEMSYGLNGGTSIAEQMIYSPKGIIAYFGADREALGSTYAYYDNGTLVAPNDFGDLITEDGTVAGYYIGTQYYGYATIGMMGYYAKALYAYWIPWLNQRDPYQDGMNDNPWGRSYFEYSVLGDPALKVAGSGGSNPSYTLPTVKIPNANYDSSDMPIITRGQQTTVRIATNAPKVKAELLYLEHDTGMSTYAGTTTTYYDFVLNMTTLSPVSSSNGKYNFTFKFTPNREGMYILSVYTPDGKNTRFYMDCGMPTPPAISLALKEKHFMKMPHNTVAANTRAVAPDVRVITLIDNGNVEYGKYTNVTALVYNQGTAPANNVNVSFYLENYTLVFQSMNLTHPLVNLGYKVVSSIPAGGFAYVTIPWKSYNLWALNHSWDPFNSSARWQYLVANAQVSGDSNPANNENWALFHVHLNVDVWAQKVFVEKDPVLGEPNNISLEISNVGTTDVSNTTVYVVDDYSLIAAFSDVHIAPGQTVFYTVPWTPTHPGVDDIAFLTVTPGDNNTRNNIGHYYPNGYYSVTNFTVLTYDVAPVNASAVITTNGTEIGVEMYNYGPLASVNTTANVSLYAGIYSADVESPHPYPNNYDHTWKVEAPYGAEGMALHFAYLDVEPGYDYVYIYNAEHQLVAEYTGLHSNMWSPYIHSSVAYVRLVSDVYVNYSGFMIDAIATHYLYVGSLNFTSMPSGGFETQTILYTAHKIAGPIGVAVDANTPGEYATLTTGGLENNYNVISLNVVDNVAPVITNYGPTSVVNVRDPWINVSYHDAVYSGFKYINVTVDGVMIPSCRIESSGLEYGNISAHVPFMLADGEHTVTVTLVDNGGNAATESWTFTVDATAPKLVLSTPTNIGMAATDTIEIKGTTDPGANVTVNGVVVSVASDGSFSYEAHLSDGFNVFTVEAKDAAGNVAEVQVTALYLPELGELWANITAIYKEIGNISGEISSLQTSVSSLQQQVNALNAELSALKQELSDNVTMLENAMKENKTAMINMINDNITAINKEINDIKDNKLPALKNEIDSANTKNKEQDTAIGTSNIIGIIGIILALVAIVIAAMSMKKGGKPGVPASSSSEPEKEDVSLDEEPEEEEDLEEI